MTYYAQTMKMTIKKILIMKKMKVKVKGQE